MKNHTKVNFAKELRWLKHENRELEAEIVQTLNYIEETKERVQMLKIQQQDNVIKMLELMKEPE